MSRIGVQESSQLFVQQLSRLSSRLGMFLGLLCTLLPALTQAHDIPSRITVNAFVKPEGNTLTALLRVPMEAFGEISFPRRISRLGMQRVFTLPSRLNFMRTALS